MKMTHALVLVTIAGAVCSAARQGGTPTPPVGTIKPAPDRAPRIVMLTDLGDGRGVTIVRIGTACQAVWHSTGGVTSWNVGCPAEATSR